VLYRLAGSVAVVLACAGVAGCGSAKPVASASVSGSAVSASASATANYWPTLNGINTKLAADIGQIRSARTPTAVSAAAMTAESDVYSDFYRLAGMTPPSALQPAQDALVSALRTFRGVLTSAGSAADSSEVCAGSSALAMLSSSAGAAQLRAAEARLSAANPTSGARAGSVWPPATAYTHRRLANGALVRRAVPGGLGQLTIHNGNDQDAVVSLVRRSGSVAALALYVRAKSSATTTSVADGTYQVYYTTGSDWDSREHLFTRFCDFEKLNKNIAFTTTQGSGVSRYTTEQITLNTVFAGNVTASKVPADKYPGS
jgi:hypothetical protein